MKTVVLLQPWSDFEPGQRFTVVARIPCNPVEREGRQFTPHNLRVVIEGLDPTDTFHFRTVPEEYTAEPYRVGQGITVERNQGDRDGTVLAVDGIEALIEYEMPNGTSALNVISLGDKPYRAVAYTSLPKKWQRLLVANEAEWIGRPQQSGRNRQLPQPAELFNSPVCA